MAKNIRTAIEYATPDNISSISQMNGLLEMEARAVIIGGVAVDPCIAVGLENPQQVRPSQIFSDGEAAFVGSFHGLELVDFTAAIKKYGGEPGANYILPPGEELITHGLVFEVKPELEACYEGNLGGAYLMKHVAILPGSVYTITRLTL